MLVAPSAGRGRVRPASGRRRARVPRPWRGRGPAVPSRWRERLLDKKGALDWRSYATIAANYHRAEIIDYRFGPRAEDFADAAKKPASKRKQPSSSDDRPLIHQPYADGLYKHNAGAWARLNPGPDSEGGGGAWLMSGQLLFAPAPGVPAKFLAGCSNVRTADGAHGPDQGICMRLVCSWVPDFWVRNQISAPQTHGLAELARHNPGLPVPPIATARGVGGASVTGFLAFQNGVISAAGTGNDDYTLAGVPYPHLQLPKGKVPTALAVTPNNEYVLATVWDPANKRGQVAVISVMNRINGQERIYRYGFPGWPSCKGLKLLGFVDLPFAAPMAIDVTVDTRLGNTRGHGDNAGDDFAQQATRDRWLAAASGAIDVGDLYWKQTPRHGYAIVRSRAENRVAIIDLAPLFAYHRTMCFTTPERHQQTMLVGTKKDEWPHTFEHAPAQIPVVAATWKIPQPTAVATGNRWNTYKTPRSARVDPRIPLHTAYVGTMAGRVLCFNVRPLFTEGPERTLSDKPIGSFAVGRNPTQIFHGYHSTTNDDLFVVSRVERTITHAEFNGRIRAVLQDRRLVDPVSCFVSVNNAGYGGSGKGKAVYAHVLSVCDFAGKQVLTYVVDDGMNVVQEQVPILDAAGKPAPFIFGSATPTMGHPFMLSVDEVI
jgi:hypothetical protein